MAKKQIICRVLVTTVICGTSFEPNAVVKGDEDLLKPLLKDNLLSDDKKGIEFCEEELNVEVVNLADLNKKVDEESTDPGETGKNE